MTTLPRWFLGVLAASALVLTTAATYLCVAEARHARYTTLPLDRDNGPVLVDTWRGLLCGTTCISLAAIGPAAPTTAHR